MDINTVAANVMDWMAEDLQRAGDDLLRLELVMRDAIHRLGALAIQQHLQKKKLGYEGSSRACEGKGCGCNQEQEKGTLIKLKPAIKVECPLCLRPSN